MSKSDRLFFFGLFLFSAVLFNPALSVMADGENVDLDKYRRLGELAFENHDLTQAESFFRQYARQAAPGSEAERLAKLRLAEVFIRGGQLDAAAKELSSLPEEFNGALDFERLALVVDLNLSHQNYAECEALIKSKLNNQPIPSDAYFKLLSALGIALQKQGKFAESIQCYEDLRKAAAGNKYWDFVAVQSQIFSYLENGELQSGAKLLQEELNKYPAGVENLKLRQLSLYLMIREKKFSELKPFYAQVVNSNSPDALLYLIAWNSAEHYVLSGDNKEAIPYLKDAFKFAIDVAARQNVLKQLINVYVAEDANLSAIDTIKKFLDFYPNSSESSELKLQLFHLLLKEEAYKSALELADNLIFSSDIELKYRLKTAREAALVALKQNDGALEEKYLNFIYEQSPSVSERNEGYFLLGESKMRRHDYSAAAEIFKQLIASDVNYRDRATFKAAQCYIQLKDYLQALALTKELCKSADSNLRKEGYALLPFVLEELKDYDGALKGYLKFVELYPRDLSAPKALLSAGNLEFMLKKYQAALEIYKRFGELFRSDPNYINVLYQAVLCDFYLQDPEMMKLHIKMLQDKYPTSVYTQNALFLLLDYFKEKNQQEDTKILLDNMLVLYAKGDPQLLIRINFELALLYGRMQQNSQALALLDDLLKNPAILQSGLVARICFTAGDIASMEGNFSEALEYYQKGLDNSSDPREKLALTGRLGDSNYSLYSIKLDNKYLETAIEQYKYLRENNFMSEQTLFKLGRSYELLKNRNEALRFYNELLYQVLDKSRRNQEFDGPWAAKAAYAAAHIYLRHDDPEAAVQALRVMDILKEVHLETGEEFDKLTQLIKERYKL